MSGPICRRTDRPARDVLPLDVPTLTAVPDHRTLSHQARRDRQVQARRERRFGDPDGDVAVCAHGHDRPDDTVEGHPVVRAQEVDGANSPVLSVRSLPDRSATPGPSGMTSPSNYRQVAEREATTSRDVRASDGTGGPHALAPDRELRPPRLHPADHVGAGSHDQVRRADHVGAVGSGCLPLASTHQMVNTPGRDRCAFTQMSLDPPGE